MTRSKDDESDVVNDVDVVVVHHHLEVDKEEMEDFQCRALPRNLLDVIGTHLVMVIIFSTFPFIAKYTKDSQHTKISQH